jgi:hypothetical protein
MGDINAQIGDAYKELVDTYYPLVGGSRWTTTLDLYRRTTDTGTNDLGIPTDPFTRVVQAQPCTIVGQKTTEDGAFSVPPQGATQEQLLEVTCTLTDVRPGDNLILALTGLAYNVERVSPMGTLTYLILDHKTAQIRP